MTMHDHRSQSQTESELLTKIHQGIPADLQSHFDDLIGKRRGRTISQAEYEELLRLTKKIEDLDARRVEYLAELARLRETTVPLLMKNLGLKTPPYASPRCDDRENAAASFRQGSKEALDGETHPGSELWARADAE